MKKSILLDLRIFHKCYTRFRFIFTASGLVKYLKLKCCIFHHNHDYHEFLSYCSINTFMHSCNLYQTDTLTSHHRAEQVCWAGYRRPLLFHHVGGVMIVLFYFILFICCSVSEFTLSSKSFIAIISFSTS